MTESQVVRKSKWALAHILVAWRREVGPLARKAYSKGEGPTIGELCDELADRLEGLSRAARAAGDLAREEASDG